MSTPCILAFIDVVCACHCACACMSLWLVLVTHHQYSSHWLLGGPEHLVAAVHDTSFQNRSWFENYLKVIQRQPRNTKSRTLTAMRSGIDVTQVCTYQQMLQPL